MDSESLCRYMRIPAIRLEPDADCTGKVVGVDSGKNTECLCNGAKKDLHSRERRGEERRGRQMITEPVQPIRSSTVR